MTNVSEISSNPFSVKTPENLSAQELVELFVPYPEFENLQMSGHQFLNGHRGSGKSMMLRMMSPDSQMLYRQCPLFKLPYFGIYLSIKATELNAPEYERLHLEPSGTPLSEHVLTTRLLSSLFSSIKVHCLTHLTGKEAETKLRNELINVFFENLKCVGWNDNLPTTESTELKSASSMVDYLIRLIDRIQLSTVQYIKRRSFSDTIQPYKGALLGFQDILLPIVKSLTMQGLIPSPVYFLLDDADNLNMQQTQILNTWVSYRSTKTISLKISTQLNYKTYKTTSGSRIESPHDFSSINFTSVQTGSFKERYPELVKNIVRKRLEKYKAQNADPNVFFPNDEAQEMAITLIAEEYKKKWHLGSSGSYRAGDDAYRYARPEYIRQLAQSRQGATYRYAGFDQLVHISSGIIRFFLEPAARMFTEQQQINGSNPVMQVSPSVQDAELRKQADQLLLYDFKNLEDEASKDGANLTQLRDIQRLRNIVRGIGSLFKAHIMNDKATQRRVFSFSISDEASQEIKNILNLGIIYGYFYEGSIGDKGGMGRKTLYVLSRKLAPAFLLDPMGFSGYLTVTNGFLLQIARNPNLYTSRLRGDGFESSSEEEQQLSLLGEGHGTETAA